MTTIEALMLLAQTHAGLGAAHDALKEDWKPDVPPPTILAATMGKALVAAAATASDAELSQVLACVERILTVGEEAAAEVVATGFLEAIVAALDMKAPGSDRLIDLMGPKARKYCSDWMAFTGSAAR